MLEYLEGIIKTYNDLMKEAKYDPYTKSEHQYMST